MKTDVYQRITNQIVHELEQGVRPWMKPWSAEHAEGRIVRPVRFNGLPYNGINVLMLWGVAMEKGYSAPTWMTFKQALEFNAHVRKGEHGSLVVYADKITRTETDETTGEESEQIIPFMKGYTVLTSNRSTACLSASMQSRNQSVIPCSASRMRNPSSLLQV